MSFLAFIDTETTGLDLELHDIWELALIVRGHPNPAKDGEYVWQLPISLSLADPMALDISGWYERSIQWGSDGGVGQDMGDKERHYAYSIAGMTGNQNPVERQFYDKRDRTGLRLTLRRVCDLINGAHLVGAVPDFDAYRLRQLLGEYGLLPTWHYHLVDIEALMVGYLSHQNQNIQTLRLPNDSSHKTVTLPWKSDHLSTECGVAPPTKEERHTALGDARWAERVYNRVVLGT